MFDEVFFYFIKKFQAEGEEEARDHRILQTGATETTAAKDRSGRLPKAIIDPTMQSIYDLMMGQENE
jgi:hypothetical protein